MSVNGNFKIDKLLIGKSLTRWVTFNVTFKEKVTSLSWNKQTWNKEVFSLSVLFLSLHVLHDSEDEATLICAS